MADPDTEEARAATPINLDVLYSPQMTAYLDGADRRIVIGFRAALEALGVPIPDAALRKPSGSGRGVANIMRRYNSDHPVEAQAAAQRKLLGQNPA